MDWAWIAVMTLKLTKENLIRIKNAFMKFIAVNPELSAVGFLIVIIVTMVLIIKYLKSS